MSGFFRMVRLMVVINEAGTNLFKGVSNETETRY